MGRPHYHACIFNHDFEDKKLWYIDKKTKLPLYRSAILETLWQFGYSSVGELTWQSAAYTARYIMKKLTGKRATELNESTGLSHYEKLNSYGEIVQIKPEYTTMSRRPGIAKNWIEKYKNDVYPHDFIIYKGQHYQPPRYYDHLYELASPEDYEKIKDQRILNSYENKNENTPERLATKLKCKTLQLKPLKRTYENDTQNNDNL